MAKEFERQKPRKIFLALSQKSSSPYTRASKATKEVVKENLGVCAWLNIYIKNSGFFNFILNCLSEEDIRHP